MGAHISTFDPWAGSGWHSVKSAADRTLAATAVFAIAWAATNGVFEVDRASNNRAVASVRLGGIPAVLLAVQNGPGLAAATYPATAEGGLRRERVAIAVSNGGPDGVVLGDGTLTGPYLAGAARLVPDASGYILPAGTVYLRGTVVVDCTAAASVAAAVAEQRQPPAQAPTEVAVTVRDANGTLHRETLVIDTTAFAVQGQVCTS